MLPRILPEELRRKLRHFPVLVLLGPRQCGKTTFIRGALPGWRYLDLEKPSDLVPLKSDVEGRLDSLGDRVIFDEAQRLPELFAVLRSFVDANRKQNGRYVLLGSASPELIRGVSETLAGRAAFLELTPFQWREVAGVRQASLASLWLKGGFPDAFLVKDAKARWDWYEGYTQTFLERDLPALGITVSSTQMRRLWGMLAHAHGNLWNASQFGASLGINYHTVNRYADILEHTFLIRRLPPFHSNLKKRLVKSPKIYLRDPGLLHYFLGIRDRETLDVYPARGASWEGFLLEQLISLYRQAAPGARPYFWRTSAGAEVDLLMDVGNRRVPFEFKLHASPDASQLKGLRNCMDDLGIGKGYVIYPGRENYSLKNGIEVLSAETLLGNPKRIAQL